MLRKQVVASWYFGLGVGQRSGCLSTFMMGYIKRVRYCFLLPALMVAFQAVAATPPGVHPPTLESGFHLLYETKFVEARSHFLAWQKAHPEDPLGYAWEATSCLFEDLYDKGVLTSAYFLDDKRFFAGAPGKENDERLVAFLAATDRAQNLARHRLKINSRDAEALYTLAVTTGMLADYNSLIERQQLRSLKFIRQSEAYAKALLAVRPDSADAYVSLGAANYIIGSLPAAKRFFLWLGGIRGDKELGMKQLAIAAKDGVYLRPFAEILLALAALREKQTGLARAEFQSLVAEFPENHLFVHELALLNASSSPDARHP
jgi:hypothetical protein